MAAGTDTGEQRLAAKNQIAGFEISVLDRYKPPFSASYTDVAQDFLLYLVSFFDMFEIENVWDKVRVFLAPKIMVPNNLFVKGEIL